MTDPKTITRGLSEAQRKAVLQSESWSGDVMMSPTLGSLNSIELLHVDVVKNGEGRIIHWAARLTPLGLAVRDELRKLLQDTP